MFHAKFGITRFTCSPLILKCPKHCPFMAKTWSSHGPSNWFFLNLNLSAHGFSMPNFTLLVYPVDPFPRNGQNMALLRPKHGPSNWFFLNLNLCAQGCSMPNFTLLGLSCIPLSYKWPKDGPFKAKTWSSYGPSNLFFLNLKQCAQECSCNIPKHIAKFYIL